MECIADDFDYDLWVTPDFTKVKDINGKTHADKYIDHTIGIKVYQTNILTGECGPLTI
jgi:hypothetical protein